MFFVLTVVDADNSVVFTSPTFKKKTNDVVLQVTRDKT